MPLCVHIHNHFRCLPCLFCCGASLGLLAWVLHVPGVWTTLLRDILMIVACTLLGKSPRVSSMSIQVLWLVWLFQQLHLCRTTSFCGFSATTLRQTFCGCFHVWRFVCLQRPLFGKGLQFVWRCCGSAILRQQWYPNISTFGCLVPQWLSWFVCQKLLLLLHWAVWFRAHILHLPSLVRWVQLSFRRAWQGADHGDDVFDCFKSVVMNRSVNCSMHFH